MRRYFIMDRSLAQPEDEFTALEMCIGANNTQRYSLDGTKLYIKTTQKAIDDLLVEWGNLYTWEQILQLTYTTEYTIDENNLDLPNLYVELAKPEWTEEFIL